MMTMAIAAEVLIIEDDTSTRELLAAIVVRNRYQPVLASDGRSGLALLEARRFAAVILDLLLPEVSGIKILTAMAASAPDVLSSIVVVTAALELLQRAEVQRAGALVRKPFEVRDMERALLACCRS